MTNSKCQISINEVVGRRTSNVRCLHTTHRLPERHGHRAPTFTFSHLSRLSRCLRFTACCLLLTFLLAVPASAGITVFDAVATVNQEVKVKALTRGRLFSEGGKLVTFYIDRDKIDSLLSGGDGYAFLKYRASSAGIKIIKAESGNDSDEGTLLVTGMKDRVIMIEIESTLFDSLLSFKPASKSKEALTTLSKKFRILYLSSLIGMSQSRMWLRENQFPEAPVLQWEGESLIDDLREKHVPLYGIIASPDVLKDASGIEKRFSFIETDDAREVKNWDELIKEIE